MCYSKHYVGFLLSIVFLSCHSTDYTNQYASIYGVKFNSFRLQNNLIPLKNDFVLNQCCNPEIDADLYWWSINVTKGYVSKHVIIKEGKIDAEVDLFFSGKKYMSPDGPQNEELYLIVNFSNNTIMSKSIDLRTKDSVMNQHPSLEKGNKILKDWGIDIKIAY